MFSLETSQSASDCPQGASRALKAGEKCLLGPTGSRWSGLLRTDPSQIRRQMDELFQKDMQAIGPKVEFSAAHRQEDAKASRAGKLVMWQLGTCVLASDGTDSLIRFYGPAAGGNNQSRFKLPAMGALYEKSVRSCDNVARPPGRQVPPQKQKSTLESCFFTNAMISRRSLASLTLMIDMTVPGTNVVGALKNSSSFSSDQTIPEFFRASE